jgi:hypothetical protein
MDSAQGEAMARGITRTDVVVVAMIVTLGALQVLLVRRGDVFVSGDTTYLELARSIVEGAPYGFNDMPGTLLPPGLPSFLALLCLEGSCGHMAATRAIAVFTTLGFLFSYLLIRRIGGRAVAAAVCLLLMSSPEIFSLSTNLVFSDTPCFAVMSLALWLALGLDAARSTRGRVARSGLFAASVAVCLVLRSAAVALLGGVVAWLGATWLMDRASTRRRLLALAPALLLGTALQGAWMAWAGRHQVSEWPLGGYPKSYLSQVLIVSGNEPELGQADWSDLLRRVDGNLRNYTASAAEIVTHHWYLPDWGSPAISLALALILVGLCASLLQRGGALHDSTFLVSAAMLVLWPWDVEVRLALPLLPLGCFYLWRGARELARQARLRPRALGTALIAFSLPLGWLAATTATRLRTIQPLASAAFWIALAGAALWLLLAGERSLRSGFASRVLRPSLVSASLTLLLGGLVALGVAGQLQAAHVNLAFEVAKARTYPDIQAAQWLHQHTGSGAVLMARQVDVVHHHSGRRVVWFPPLSDTNTLMDGIERYGVQWVVVTEKDWSYWLPKESDVFRSLLEAHPEAFQLEAAGPKWRVFAVSTRRRAASQFRRGGRPVGQRLLSGPVRQAAALPAQPDRRAESRAGWAEAPSAACRLLPRDRSASPEASRPAASAATPKGGKAGTSAVPTGAFMSAWISETSSARL